LAFNIFLLIRQINWVDRQRQLCSWKANEYTLESKWLCAITW